MASAFAQLAHEYQSVFDEAVDCLRRQFDYWQSANPILEVRNTVEPKVEAYRLAVCSVQPAAVPVANSARFYIWLSVCMTVSALAEVVAAPLVSPLLSVLAVSPDVALWLAALGVPLLVAHVSDGGRMSVLGSCFVSGLLRGYGLQHCHFAHWTPPLPLLPALIALVVLVGGAQLAASDRPVLLAGVIGGPVLVLLGIGQLLGALDTAYLLITLAFALLFTVNLQLRLAMPSQDMVGEANWLLAGCTLTLTVVTWLTSVSKEAADQHQ